MPSLHQNEANWEHVSPIMTTKTLSIFNLQPYYLHYRYRFFFPCRPEKNAYDGIILEIIYTIFKEKHSLKAGIQYMTFAQIFASIYSLDESKLVTKNQNQSADFGQLELTDLAENHILYDEHGFQIIIFFSSRLWICVVKGHQTCLSRF